MNNFVRSRIGITVILCIEIVVAVATATASYFALDAAHPYNGADWMTGLALAVPFAIMHFTALRLAHTGMITQAIQIACAAFLFCLAGSVFLLGVNEELAQFVAFQCINAGVNFLLYNAAALVWPVALGWDYVEAP